MQGCMNEGPACRLLLRFRCTCGFFSSSGSLSQAALSFSFLSTRRRVQRAGGDGDANLVTARLACHSRLNGGAKSFGLFVETELTCALSNTLYYLLALSTAMPRAT